MQFIVTCLVYVPAKLQQEYMSNVNMHLWPLEGFQTACPLMIKRQHHIEDDRTFDLKGLITSDAHSHSVVKVAACNVMMSVCVIVLSVCNIWCIHSPTS